MRPAPLHVRALLALVLCLHVGDARRDYQVILNFANATDSAQSTAVSWANYWYKALDTVWFNCDFYDPSRWGARSLGGTDGGHPDERASMLRGKDGGRNLQVSCPSSCSSSGSTKCKSIGCAFCGTCRRSRQLQTTNETATRLTPAAALKVEKWFNSYLMKFCAGAPGCVINAKIYQVLTNGTTYPLTGSTIAL